MNSGNFKKLRSKDVKILSVEYEQKQFLEFLFYVGYRKSNI